MPLFKSKKRDNDLSDAIGISHAICDDVLACGRGVQAAVFEIKGASYVTEMPSKLELSLAGFNHFLTRMPSGITLTAVCHREKETSSLKTGIKNAQARAFDAAYQRDIGKKLYKNCWYLHLVVEPQLLGQGHGSLAGKINKLSSNLGGMVSRQTEATTRLLNEVAAQLMSHLSAYSPVRLSLTGARNMLSVLMLPLNAGQHILCSSSKVSSKVGQNHKDALSDYLKYQQGHLVSAYAREGIYFGRDTLVYEDCTNRRIYGAILYIKNHASALIPPTFDEIYHAPCEFIILHTYSPYTSSGAIKACRDRKRQIENNKEDAHTQVHSVTEIVDAVHENVLGLGDYIQGFFVFGATKPELEENITLLRDRAQKVSVGLVREKIGLEGKFFSQFPGLKSLAPRVEVINSKNFVDMANFHNEDAGHAGDNHLKSAVAILETPAKSLAWFNCHASGEASNPALGHTLMLGGSGGGKTVMLGFLMNQLQRFNGRLWVFDRNQGLEIAVRALGGQYAVLSADNMPKLNPFLLPDTTLNRDFLVRLLATLLLREGEVQLPAKILNQLTKCVQYNYQCEKKVRSLRTATQVLPVDFERSDELARWMRPNLNGALFDNDEDDLSIGDIHGFDLTHFLQPSQAHALSALFQYLMHLMSNQLDGRLSTLICDEGWQFLLNPALSDIAREILVTWRKLNGHMVLATQDASTLATQSAIGPILITNTATKIILPNAAASLDIFCDYLGLTEAEFYWVKNSRQSSRQFLVKQDESSTVCGLDLTTLPEYLRIFSANAVSLKCMRRAIAQVGSESESWLPVFHELLAQAQEVL